VRAFPKPSEIEGKITLSPAKRRKLLDELCEKQKMKCCTCPAIMTREPGRMNTAELGHKNPQPMGCKKRDNLDNILGAQCHRCNFERGSKREGKHG